MQAAMEQMQRNVEAAQRREAAAREQREALGGQPLSQYAAAGGGGGMGLQPLGSVPGSSKEAEASYNGPPRSYEERLSMENRKLANAPLDMKRKVYLRVPFKEKKIAIGFGAVFDTDRNRWCCTQEQAIALKDVEPFKDWLPEDALPAALRTKVNCSDNVQGADREAFKRLADQAKTATPQELRQLFCTEIMSCGMVAAGEMWLEFKEAMSGDMKQRGAIGSEVAIEVPHPARKPPSVLGRSLEPHTARLKRAAAWSVGKPEPHTVAPCP